MKRENLPARIQNRSSGAPRIATLLLAVLLSCVTTGAFAYDFTAVNDEGVTIYYNYTNERTEAEVTYNNGQFDYSGDVTIPATVTVGETTLNVTSIGMKAFNYCPLLTSVTIPNSVTSIGNDAFNSCYALTSVTIPNSVMSIGEYAFCGCIKLASVTIGNSVTSIGGSAFSGCRGLAEVTLFGSELPTCGDDTFYGISSNATLYCAPGLETSCSANESWSNSFGSIYTLVTLASGERLSNYITDSNKGTVTKLKIYGEINSEDITLMNKMATSGALSVIDMSEATTATVDLIGLDAFSGCGNLTSISLPDGITSIGQWAFGWCSSLASIDIPDGVTSIGYGAFVNCSSLVSVTIPNSVTTISNGAFNGCSSLTSVTIGSSVTSIGGYAFANCSSLTEVILLGSTLPNFGDYAFNDVDLSKATLYCAPGVETSCSTNQPWSSFGSIYTLVTLASGERLSNYITEGNKSTVTKLKIFGEINSEDIALMKEMATSEALSVIDMSEATAASKDLIGDQSFYACGKLTSISLPKGVTSIGQEAFKYCPSLTSVTIPDGVTSIGQYAFWGCEGLTSVSIPNSVTSIGNYAFSRCSSLASVTIPDKVTSIGSSAFHNCTGLKSVTIPNSVTSISDYAFSRCSSLTSVTIPNSVTSIGEWAFNNCTGLKSVTIPNSVTSIGKCAFDYCSGLTSVTIGSSVTSIGEWAFGYCTGLTEVTIQGKTLPTTCATDAFYNINFSDATLYCKTALLETCAATDPWKNFKYIVAKPFSITISDAGIATGCFDDDLDFSKVADVKAYIASGFNPETGKVLMTNVTEVPAGTGFLVKGEANTYKIPAAATKYVYVNMLVGILEETTVAKTDDTGTYTNYVLVNDATNGVGFYLANGDAVPANKAYLQIPTSAVTTDEDSEAKTVLSLSFDDTDDTTGIIPVSKLAEETSGKAVIYNLNGQRKQSLTKGLNIVNGKKIFVK